MTKLSIIVLTHNRLTALRECLIRIQSQTEERDAEIIVIDNGSADQTGEWLDVNAPLAPLVTSVIHRPTNEGVCARNHGILAAKGQFIAQVDDDVLVMAGWDRVLMEPLERDPQIGATGCDGHYQEQSWSKTAWSAGLIDDRRRPVAGNYCDLLTGWCKMWRNIQVREGYGVGSPMFLYDEQFNPHWGEESDMDMAIRCAGYRLMLVRQVATHRSLKDWKAVMANEGPTAMHYADDHFLVMKRKWENDPRLTFEGPRVGLSNGVSHQR